MDIWITLLVFVVFGNQFQKGWAGRPYVNDPDCPRQPELIHTRHCLKKCRSDLDCKGRHKRCLCDGSCGRSCVKENKTCQGLKTVFNGKYEIVPHNNFGARAVYSCDDGFMLVGSRDRTCQGDSFWSGIAPTCETQGFKRTTETELRKTRPLTRRGTKSQRSRPRLRTLVTSLPRKCKDPLEVQHAYHDGPKGQKVFPLGMQLNYNCSFGYQINGFIKAMCVGDGRWVGPRMTCSPKRCNHPGDIAHGTRDGSIFMYPNKVKYRCTDGYVLKGRDFRVCEANGQWSGILPKCVPVECARLVAPSNGNITWLYAGMTNTYGAEMKFSCNNGFMLNGSVTRQCKKDGTWGGRTASCPMVDCGLPGPFYNGYIEQDQYGTNFGATVQFHCFGRATFEGESVSAACRADGQWSHPLPHCWSKCKIRSISNGSLANGNVAVGDYVPHREKVGYKCHTGHELDKQHQPECHNGSWNFLPTCVPASCSDRPPDITDGMVRYHTHKHGNLAKYHCNTGFQLAGEMFITCHYGNWTGKAPECEPIYCDYPGRLENGEILLVGMIGKYEYRPYVRTIGHNKQIEFQCRKGYKRIGAPGATCVDGKWSPEIRLPKTPRCQEIQHPKLEYFLRGKRSAAKLEVSDDRNYMYTNSQTAGFCKIPDVAHGYVINSTLLRYVPHGGEMQVKCEPEYKLSWVNNYASKSTSVAMLYPKCNNGDWSHEIMCVKLKTNSRIT